MKKTIACLAMIAGAVSSVNVQAADAKKANKPKNDERAPASAGETYVACRPAYNVYGGDEAYKNNCLIPMQTFQVPATGFVPPGSTVEALGCDDKHVVVVSSRPLSFRCLPPGVVEL